MACKSCSFNFLKIFRSRSMISHDRGGKDWISDTKTAPNSTLNFQLTLFLKSCIRFRGVQSGH